jgi:RHS repeat-associated protein
VSYDASNHRTGVSYDANGNQLSSVTPPYGEQYTWSAENQISTVTGGGGPEKDYIYDPWGKRIFEWSSDDPEALRFVLYGEDGKLLCSMKWRATHTASGYVPDYDSLSGRTYFAGRVLGQATDRLGSIRSNGRQTDPSTYAISYAPRNYYPYGEERTTPQEGTESFATYTRDSAANSRDYADQRYYSPGMGRFLSPDPLGGDPGSPQSLNRYAYVVGDPVNLNDPLGLCPPGYVEADSSDRSSIVQTAESYVGQAAYSSGGHFKTKDGLLTGIDCSGLVSQALAGIEYSGDSFTQAGTLFTTGQTSELFDSGSTFAVGDIIWFPGHVGIVSSVDTSGKVLAFIGSQTSTGPAVVDLTDPSKTYWQSQMESAKAYKPCVPASGMEIKKKPPLVLRSAGNSPEPSSTVPNAGTTPYWKRAMAAFLAWIDAIPLGPPNPSIQSIFK